MINSLHSLPPQRFSALLTIAKSFRVLSLCVPCISWCQRDGCQEGITLLTYYFLYWWRLLTETKTRVAVGKQSAGASAVPLLKSDVFAESKRPTAFEAATNDLNCVTPPLWMSNGNRFVFQARCCNHPGWYQSIILRAPKSYCPSLSNRPMK